MASKKGTVGSSNQSRTNEQKSVYELISSYLESLSDDPSYSIDPMIGISSGYDKLDESTLGFRRGDLIVVAGRPSMGKSTLVKNFAENVSIKESGFATLVFTLEKSAANFAKETLASLSRVDIDQIQQSLHDEGNLARIRSVASISENISDLYVDDNPTLTVADIRARASSLVKKHGALNMVIVDSLQLIRPERKRENLSAEISDVTRDLKAVAKEANCPVILVSQLNRQVEQRADKRPTTSDLRDSGAIEENADLILFLYQHSKYYPDTGDSGLTEVIIAKNAHGPINQIKLKFHGRLCRFDNYHGT